MSAAIQAELWIILLENQKNMGVDPIVKSVKLAKNLGIT